ncbi:MAG: bifunctional glutamate N-acetyltransferase/amino-acid acetyltransferase ArgJ [Planctomycetota bacterium]
MAKEPRLFEIPGFRLAAVKAGLKASGQPDLGLIAADEPVSAAGVFTTNQVSAAPVKLCRAHLRENGSRARAVLVNAGIANACTGAQGLRDARACARAVARALRCRTREVLIASTGIIGKSLPMDKMLAGIEQAAGLLPSSRSGRLFSRAILTTDTAPKEAGTAFRLGGKTVRLAGATKGSGMIAPRMATTLTFLLTDAAVRPAVLQELLEETVRETLNRVTIDSDTSTNDTALLLASGRAGHGVLARARSREALTFRAALREVLGRLARQIARDGEGATRLVRVAVKGAKSRYEAEWAARAVADSPLVKTALAGADPNWGRILMAVGKSAALVREERVRVAIAGVPVFRDGSPLPFRPSEVSRRMKREEVLLEIDLRLGRGEAEILTCDLNHGYITVNAEYHT